MADDKHLQHPRAGASLITFFSGTLNIFNIYPSFFGPISLSYPAPVLTHWSSLFVRRAHLLETSPARWARPHHAGGVPPRPHITTRSRRLHTGLWELRPRRHLHRERGMSVHVPIRHRDGTVGVVIH